MKNTDPIDKEEVDTKENKSEFAQKSVNGCKNKILNIVYNPRGGTLQSFFQRDHQRIVIEYYFGKSNSYTKRLYSEIMELPRRYG